MADLRAREPATSVGTRSRSHPASREQLIQHTRVPRASVLSGRYRYRAHGACGIYRPLRAGIRRRVEQADHEERLRSQKARPRSREVEGSRQPFGPIRKISEEAFIFLERFGIEPGCGRSVTGRVPLRFQMLIPCSGAALPYATIGRSAPPRWGAQSSQMAVSFRSFSCRARIGLETFHDANCPQIFAPSLVGYLHQRLSFHRIANCGAGDQAEPGVDTI